MVILNAVKTAISLPDDVFRAVDAQAKRLKVSRSEFFARAAVRLLATLEDERVRASYDEGFADADSTQSSFTGRATRRALLAVEWKDK
jgi:predicted transcriptional regulator